MIRMEQYIQGGLVGGVGALINNTPLSLHSSRIRPNKKQKTEIIIRIYSPSAYIIIYYNERLVEEITEINDKSSSNRNTEKSGTPA